MNDTDNTLRQAPHTPGETNPTLGEVAPSPGVTSYPAWVCDPCGQKHGRGMPEGHIATFHLGECGICGAVTSVTEPRDYRHLRKGWDEDDSYDRMYSERAEADLADREESDNWRDYGTPDDPYADGEDEE